MTKDSRQRSGEHADGLPNRRQVLGVGVGGFALAMAQHVPAAAAAVKTKAKIVVAGAGAAGLAAASRLSRMLDGAQITLIDARQEHYYQPGFTLVAAGLKSPQYPVSQTRQWIPPGVAWIEEPITEFRLDSRRVVTARGTIVPYDFLVVATGLSLDYDAIDGMETQRIGENGLGSLYAGPVAAHKTWLAMSRFTDTGGVGLFLRPATEMKCAGAPLKYTFITDDIARMKGTRAKSKLIYAAHNDTLFGVPIVNEKVRMLFEDRGVEVRKSHVLKAIDLSRRVATFDNGKATTSIDYDFINVIPPMRAPAAVRASSLPWQSGPFAADGWVEVDPSTLRHLRFSNVFAVGDVAGVPKGKTAASVKWQVPVAVEHLVADIAGRNSTAAYDGYTSCPLITRIGRAMLIEFDYRNNLVPSFPGIIAPLEELWISWLMKEIALKPTYFAMLRGRA